MQVVIVREYHTTAEYERALRIIVSRNRVIEMTGTPAEFDECSVHRLANSAAAHEYAHHLAADECNWPEQMHRVYESHVFVDDNDGISGVLVNKTFEAHWRNDAAFAFAPSPGADRTRLVLFSGLYQAESCRTAQVWREALTTHPHASDQSADLVLAALPRPDLIMGRGVATSTHVRPVVLTTSTGQEPAAVQEIALALFAANNPHPLATSTQATILDSAWRLARLRRTLAS